MTLLLKTIAIWFVMFTLAVANGAMRARTPMEKET